MTSPFLTGIGNPPPAESLDLAASAAGEEDPGASLDMAADPSDAPAPMHPGDEAPPGTAGTGEALCPQCGGSGKVGGADCSGCGGTGKVSVGIGGA